MTAPGHRGPPEAGEPAKDAHRVGGSGPPADQAARDDVAGRLDLTLLVHAGAGTGKTTALVGRIVALVTSGTAELHEIAAITFTEAAAAELRDRVRSRLDDAAGDATLPPAARARARLARSQIDTSTLTTLHGFAQRILAEHPLEAGLPPRFRILDDVEASLWFDRHWTGFVESLTTEPEWRSTLLRAHALGIRLPSLRAVALAIWDQTDRLGDSPTTLRPLPDLDLTEVFARREVVRGDLARCGDPSDRLALHAEALLAALAPLDHAHPPAGEPDDSSALDLLDVLDGCPRAAVARRGRKANWPDVDAAREHTAALGAAVDRILLDQRAAVFDRLLSRLHDLVTVLAAERLREGVLTFQDLLVVARDLLRRDDGVRRSCSSRYRRLLIDEFQDTDPLQAELALLLTSGDPGAGHRAWDTTRPEPGRLFVAGDPTQSIYRFRRADLGVYDRMEDLLAGGARELSVNFRSVPGVLEWVDHVFARLLEGAEPGVQAPHRALTAHRPPTGTAAPPVIVFGGPLDASVGEVRNVEADAVAGAVHEVVSCGWEVTDPSTGELRPARYRDVAILIPARNVLGALETSLEAAGIPARVESRSFVFDSPEVRELVGIITALDDPTDEVAVVGALRSPAFGCGDDDLLTFRRAGGRFDYREPAPPGLDGSHPVVAATAALHELHLDARWQRVSDTVAAVIARRRLFAVALGRRRPRDHWRRYRFLLDAARAFDDAGGAGHREFVEWAASRCDEGAQALESPGSEPDDDAVRLLTVHGAKGLEFPVVVLAGLQASERPRPGPVRWRTGGGYEVALGSTSAGSRVATAGYDALGATEDALDVAERVRVLYVGATRARDHLLVSLHHPAGRPSHAATLHGLHAPFGDAPAERREPGPPPGRSGREPHPGPRGRAVAPTAENYDDWLRERRALLEEANRPATVPATRLVHASTTATHPEPAPPGRAPGRGRGAAGTRIGRAVHAVLQHVDLPPATDLARLASEQAEAEGIPERAAEVEELAAGIIACPAITELLAAGPWWREVPVAAPLGDVVVEGVVDLLVDTADGLVVVDYKTDHLADPAAVDAALERYTPQGAAYAHALVAATGRPVTRCVFVFARRPGPALVREVADLEGAIMRLPGGLSGSPAGGPHPLDLDPV